MSKWKEGDRVKVITREVTEDDRKLNRYFEHMQGLVGTIQGVYEDNEIAIQVDPSTIGAVTKGIHDEATRRLRTRFAEEATEDVKSKLTAQEMNFQPNYVILAQASDLEKA